MVSNLSHFLSLDNLKKFRNFNRHFWISKKYYSDQPPVKLELLMFSQRVDMSTSKHPFWGLGINMINFSVL